MEKLSVDNVCWSPFKYQLQGKKVLKHIHLQVREGQFVGLIGPNGCGKTSLLRCIFRYHTPQSGRIYIHGQDIWQQSARWCAQRLAVVLQEFPSDFGLNVYDVIVMGRTPHKRWLEPLEDSEQHFIENLMAHLHIEHLASKFFTLLSGGEKQRVLLARALAQQPEILILDEPTNHLDPGYQIHLLQLLRQTKLTLLASFHDLNLAAAFCDYLYVMQEGQIVAHGQPAQVLTAGLVETVFGSPVLIDNHPLKNCPRLTWMMSS